MTQQQISISQLHSRPMSYGGTKGIYAFLFRTDWMEPREAQIALETLKQFFTAPEFKIILNERSTLIKQTDIN